VRLSSDLRRLTPLPFLSQTGGALAGRPRPPIPRSRKLLPVPESQGVRQLPHNTHLSDHTAPSGPGSGRGAGPEPSSTSPWPCYRGVEAESQRAETLGGSRRWLAADTTSDLGIGVSILQVTRERRLMNARQLPPQSADLKHHYLNTVPLGRPLDRWTSFTVQTGLVSKHVQHHQQNNVTPPRPAMICRYARTRPSSPARSPSRQSHSAVTSTALSRRKTPA
jgi:hypothetical protein